jgi:hypothetical protein
VRTADRGALVLGSATVSPEEFACCAAGGTPTAWTANPTYWRIVQGRFTSTRGYAPRLNGYPSGLPSFASGWKSVSLLAS